MIKQTFWITAVYGLLLLMNIILPKESSANVQLEQSLERAAFGIPLATFRELKEDLYDVKKLSLPEIEESLHAKSAALHSRR